MISITGATGNVGVPLVRELLAAGQQVRAFVTDVADAGTRLGERVELAKGEFADARSVEAALAGVDRLYLLAPAGPDLPAWEAAFLDAARRAGVAHVVYHSVAGAAYEANAFGRWHRATEKHLEQSGMAWTHLRPAGFMSNAFMWAGSVKAQGAIYMPCGDGKMAVIDPRDIATVAAKALTSSGHEGKAGQFMWRAPGGTGTHSLPPDFLPGELAAHEGVRELVVVGPKSPGKRFVRVIPAVRTFDALEAHVRDARRVS